MTLQSGCVSVTTDNLLQVERQLAHHFPKLLESGFQKGKHLSCVVVRSAIFLHFNHLYRQRRRMFSLTGHSHHNCSHELKFFFKMIFSDEQVPWHRIIRPDCNEDEN